MSAGDKKGKFFLQAKTVQQEIFEGSNFHSFHGWSPNREN